MKEVGQGRGESKGKGHPSRSPASVFPHRAALNLRWGALQYWQAAAAALFGNMLEMHFVQPYPRPLGPEGGGWSPAPVFQQALSPLGYAGAE